MVSCYSSPSRLTHICRIDFLFHIWFAKTRLTSKHPLVCPTDVYLPLISRKRNFSCNFFLLTKYTLSPQEEKPFFFFFLKIYLFLLLFKYSCLHSPPSPTPSCPIHPHLGVMEKGKGCQGTCIKDTWTKPKVG